MADPWDFLPVTRRDARPDVAEYHRHRGHAKCAQERTFRRAVTNQNDVLRPEHQTKNRGEDNPVARRPPHQRADDPHRQEDGRSEVDGAEGFKVHLICFWAGLVLIDLNNWQISLLETAVEFNQISATVLVT